MTLVYVSNRKDRCICTFENTCREEPNFKFGDEFFAVKMLCAYYGRSCDSSGLFDDSEIAKDLNWREHEDGIDYAGIPNEEIRMKFNKILRKGGTTWGFT